MSDRPIEFPVEGLSDGEIRLRLIGDADVPAIVAACRDPEIPRWTRVPDDYGVDDAREWLSRSAAETGSGDGISLLIVGRDDRLLGSIGIVDVSWDEARCDIGYWMAAEARRRGIMTRAVRLLCAWIFDELPIERVGILASVDNQASRAVAARAGFTYEGMRRSYLVNKGTRHDVASYSLLRGELR